MSTQLVKQLERQAELELQIEGLQKQLNILTKENNELKSSKCRKNPKLETIILFTKDDNFKIYGEACQLSELQTPLAGETFRLTGDKYDVSSWGPRLQFASVASCVTALLRHGYKFEREMATFNNNNHNYMTQLWIREL